MISREDINIIPLTEISEIGFVDHHLGSYNSLIENDLRMILQTNFRITNNIKLTKPNDMKVTSVKYTIHFADINILKPTYNKNMQTFDLYPSYAKSHDLTYFSRLKTNNRYTVQFIYEDGTLGKEQIITDNDIEFAHFPIPVGSIKCHTYMMDKKRKIETGHDPQDIGGYFILDGKEKYISILENTAKNIAHIYRNPKDHTLVRLDFISQPGDHYDHSYQIKLYLKSNYEILVKLILGKNYNIKIPFYLLYRIFGMVSDKQILETIINDYDDISKRDSGDVLYNILNVCYNSMTMTPSNPDLVQFRGEVDAESILIKLEEIIFKKECDAIKNADKLENKIKNRVTPDSRHINARKQAIESVLKTFDERVFPHIGNKAEDRYIKLLNVGYNINKMLQVHFGASPTDRNNYAIKQILAAGPNMAKTLKQQFNLRLIQPALNLIYKAYTEALDLTKVSIADEFRKGLDPDKFLDDINKYMKSTEDEISLNKTTKVKRRMSVHPLEKKNMIQTILSLRTVKTPYKGSSDQSENSYEMRGIQPTYIGVLCFLQSVEGKGAGINKQLGIGTTITNITISYQLKEMLLSDENLIPLNKCDVSKLQSLYKVFLNGNWLGCVNNPIYFLNKYRGLRREGTIDRKTSISMDYVFTGDINFYQWYGRLASLFIIVHNNEDEYEAGKTKEFKQWILYTPELAEKLRHGEIDINYLLENQILEYLTIQEMTNVMLADYDSFYANLKNPLIRYTHLGIDINNFGIPILTCPLASYSSLIRTVYQANQRKQTNGKYTLAYFNEYVKGYFVQCSDQKPIVKTIIDDIVRSDGYNAPNEIKARATNQEDSICISRAFVESGGFLGFYYTTKEKILEKNEFINENVNPKIKNSHNIERGIVKPGTILTKGSVIMSINKVDDKTKKTEDISEFWKKNYDVYVDSVLVFKNEKNSTVYKIRLAAIRPLEIGDKLSSREGNKAINTLLIDKEDLTFDAEGNTPSLVLNPHSIPSRMLYNQVLEGIISEDAINRGVIEDGTMFRPFDPYAIVKRLQVSGTLDSKTCNRIAYNGIYGHKYDKPIYLFNHFYQRLNKMIEDIANTADNVARNPITGQPTKGIGHSAGARLGEMEHDVLIAQGASRYLEHKMFEHSDRMVIPVCTNCRRKAIYKNTDGYTIYQCKYCDEPNIVKCLSSMASDTFINFLECSGMDIRLNLKPYTNPV